MGSFSYDFETAGTRKAVLYAWWGVAVAIAAFLVTRYLVSGSVALFTAQVVYIGAAATSCAAVAAAAFRAPSGSRGRAVWARLGVALAFLTLSEVVYSWAVLSHGPASMIDMEIADYLNAAATLSFLAMLAAIVSLDRLGWLPAARLAVDSIASSVLFFAVLFRIFVAQLLTFGTPVEVSDAVRYAVYSAVGFLVVAGTAFVYAGASSRRLRPWDRLLGVGLAIFGSGVAFWPAWILATAGGPSPVVVEMVVNTLYLLGYLLLGMAAFQRVLAHDVAWSDSFSDRGARVWQGVLVVTTVFASVGVLGWWAATAPRGSAEEAVYVIVLSVAAVAMVIRTLLLSLETVRLQTRALTDEVTGVGNVHALRTRIGDLAAAAKRLDAPFMVAVVAVDEFAALSARGGKAVSDSVLRMVARALLSASSDGEVFRLNGEQFAVVGTGVDGADAETRGRVLVDAVADSGDDVRVTVSVGVACCPSAAADADEVLGCAVDACMWVKRHGGAQVAVHDQRLRAAFAVDAGLEHVAHESGVDMARALAAAADVRDPTNYRHSRNVAALAVLLAEDIGLDSARIDDLRVAAMLHDVGKIALPDAMLGGKLVAANQRRVEQEHCAMGQRLVDSLGRDGVPMWVRGHHERWDGQGYPDGLRGEQIPLESRIIALADAYDGMSAGKRYGAPMSKAAALQEIDLGIGVRFDPFLAERFIHVVGTTSALGWQDRWPAA